jgi:isoamylase
MISGGDEVARTQRGNNNAYCQDNELSWTPWELTRTQREFLAFVRRVIQLRRTEPVLRRRKFFQGRSIRGKGVKDIVWLGPSGHEMTDRLWNSPDARALGVLLSGASIDEVDERGRPIHGDPLLVLYNAAATFLEFCLPEHGAHDLWQPLLDTARPEIETGAQPLAAGNVYHLQPRSLALLRRLESSPSPA